MTKITKCLTCRHPRKCKTSGHCLAIKSALQPPETRGRPKIPPDTRRVHLTLRVPQRTLRILRARVAAHDGKSSLGLEVERAVDFSVERNVDFSSASSRTL